MISKIKNVLYLLTVCLNVQANEITAGVEFSGGKYLTASNVGVGFTIPQGWSGSLSAEGDFVMKSSQHYGMLILTTSPTNNRELLAKSLSHEPLDIGAGFIFHPSGKANNETNGLSQNYYGQAPNGKAALNGHLHILEGKFGQSVTIAIMGASADITNNNQILHNTLNTVTFFNANNNAQQPAQAQREGISVPPHKPRPVIENWNNGGYVEGINSDGQNCSYVTVQGMTMKSCD